VGLHALMQWCVEYWPRFVRGGRGEGWGSVGCFHSRRRAVRRAKSIVKRGLRKRVRVTQS
jgi:hypothetical protein